MKLVTGLRNALAQAILDVIDASVSNPAALQTYTGTMPEAMGETITDTLLVTHTLPDPAGAVDAGTLTAGAIADQNAVADGTAGWARLVDGDGVEVAYFAVGVTGSGATIEMNSVECVTGVPVRITSFAFIIAGA
ncbi:MAG TPA: hypothetical protein VIG24_10075 [Acidimicrobiia bacterium]